MAKRNVASVTETYKIPSLGKLYGDSFNEEVVIRSMTTQEEKMRLGNQGFYKTMCSILDSVVVSHEDFQSKYLTVFDFFFLMYKMRVVSYGPIYKVQVTCPHCGKTVTVPVNLDNLEVKYLPEDFSEPFEVGPLPRSKDMLKLRFMRVVDSINNEKKVKDTLAKNPNYVGDPDYIYNLASKIVEINGESKSALEVEMYVEDMQAMDASYVTQYYNKVAESVGMSNLCKEVCPSCGEDMEFGLPFNSEFFRPTFDF